MRFFRNIIPIAAFAALSVVARASEMNVQSQRGEKWWGIYVGSAHEQPFIRPFSAVTGQSNADGFTTPLLVSNLGRYVWCYPGTEVNFDGNAFRLRYNDTQPELGEQGHNLREACMVAYYKHFPHDAAAVTPPPELYGKVLYDTSIEFGVLPSQAGVVAFAERLVKEGFPKGIILLGEGWNETAGTYTFSAEAFPSPVEMVQRLHEMGFQMMLTVTPYASLSGRTYIENMRRGFLLRSEGKDPVMVSRESGYYSVYDPADEAQAEYLRNALMPLCSDYGIDGFRFDCSQLLPLLSATQTADVMKRWTAIGEGMGVAEYRPGDNAPFAPYVNVIAGALAQARSNPLLDQINTLLAGSLCGFSGCRYLPAVLNDTLSLFSQQALMAHTLQLQALSPLPTVNFAPWRIRDKALYDAVKMCLAWRVSLGGYMAELCRECVRSGEPVVRHMEYMFPRSGFSDCNDQFMLGNRYLCAPFYDDEGKRLVRLPRGIWVNRKGTRFKGPVVLTVKEEDAFAPVFELVASK